MNNPFFIEDMGLNQPYLSMMLIAPNCDFSCKDCQNRHLINDFKEFGIDELSKEYKSNPFFQGITVAGLEIFLSGNKFKDDVFEFIKRNQIEKVTIYTRFEMEDYIVEEYANKLKSLESLKELYFKTGKYIKNSESKKINIKDWEINLASPNQKFIKMK